MTVISVDDHTNAILSEIARRLNVSKDDVIKMLIKGEIRGDKMDEETEKKLKELLGGSIEKGSESIIDKVLKMKVVDKLVKGDENGDKMNLKEMLEMKMMAKLLEEPAPKSSIDPNMMMMLMMMNKGGDTDMMKMLEIMEKMNGPNAQIEEMKKMLMEKEKTEKEDRLMEVIERQNEIIEKQARDMEELKRSIYTLQRGSEGFPARRSNELTINDLKRMRSEMKALGMTDVEDPETKQLEIKHDVVRSQAELEKDKLDKVAMMVNKGVDSVDRKIDKLITILEAWASPQQKQQQIEEWQRSGQISPEEKAEIYRRMQMEYEQQEPTVVEFSQNADNVAERAAQMWQEGKTAAEIARELHIPITETYKYRPKS